MGVTRPLPTTNKLGLELEKNLVERGAQRRIPNMETNKAKVKMKNRLTRTTISHNSCKKEKIPSLTMTSMIEVHRS